MSKRRLDDQSLDSPKRRRIEIPEESEIGSEIEETLQSSSSSDEQDQVDQENEQPLENLQQSEEQELSYEQLKQEYQNLMTKMKAYQDLTIDTSKRLRYYIKQLSDDNSKLQKHIEELNIELENCNKEQQRLSTENQQLKILLEQRHENYLQFYDEFTSQQVLSDKQCKQQIRELNKQIEQLKTSRATEIQRLTDQLTLSRQNLFEERLRNQQLKEKLTSQTKLTDQWRSFAERSLKTHPK